MKNIKRILAVVVVLPFLLVIGIGVAKAIMKPGPRQLEKNPILSESEIFSEKMEKWETKTARLKKQMATLPKFTPPADGLVTTDQAQKYVSIVCYMYDMIKIQEDKIPKPEKGFLPINVAMQYARKISTMGNMLETEQLWKQKLSFEENAWIDHQMRKGTALAMKRLYEGCYGEEKRANIEYAYNRAALLADYYKLDERGEQIPQPSMIDPSEIPEQNYKLVLQYTKWLQYDRLDLKKIDFSCLIKEEGVSAASLTPIEAYDIDKED